MGCDMTIISTRLLTLHKTNKRYNYELFSNTLVQVCPAYKGNAILIDALRCDLITRKFLSSLIPEAAQGNTKRKKETDMNRTEIRVVNFILKTIHFFLDTYS